MNRSINLKPETGANDQSFASEAIMMMITVRIMMPMAIDRPARESACDLRASVAAAAQ